MITLAIETSSHQGSVALLRDGEVLFNEICGTGRSHSSLLFGTLERALSLGKPDRIVVGLGPGSYAGVRIALSAATGLALATGAELVGGCSSAALADGEYAVVGDARRGGFSFTRVRDGECAEGPLLVSPMELAERVTACGLPVYTSETVPAAAEVRYPEAVRLARLPAWEAHGELEPIYLREPHITTPRSSPPRYEAPAS